MNYSAQLVVSTVGNAPKLSSIRYMQDMTSGFCASVVEGDEAQLEDSRDGQLYWVGKMLDDRCWMLQNLALGNSTSATALTSADSNITSDWSLPKSLTAATSGSSLDTAIQSWNFGKWVLATPLLTADCGDSGINSLSQCTKVGFVDVSNEANFQPTYVASVGTWDGAIVTNYTLVTVNCKAWSGEGTSKICTAGTYDPHYLVGNYYSWNAATAGSGGKIKNEVAGESICPKGWKLPTSNTTATGSFTGLLSQYGVSSKPSGSTYNIAGDPLRLIRGGLISSNDGVRYTGQDGYYRSSTSYSNSDDAYVLKFDDSSVKPSAVWRRQLGLSVRCISE